MLNKVMIIGKLGRDPELRYTTTGTPVTTLSVATNESFLDRDGNRQERTEWHRVTVFQKQAENCAHFLAKGSLVYVEGTLQTRKWQDQQGMDRYTTEIRAQRVQFLDRKTDRRPQGAWGQEGAQGGYGNQGGQGSYGGQGGYDNQGGQGSYGGQGGYGNQGGQGSYGGQGGYGNQGGQGSYGGQGGYGNQGGQGSYGGQGGYDGQDAYGGGDFQGQMGDMAMPSEAAPVAAHITPRPAPEPQQKPDAATRDADLGAPASSDSGVDEVPF